MNKCIKIENIYIFIIISYYKHLGCVSVLSVDMAETGMMEESAVAWLTIDGMDHEVMTPEDMAKTGMTEAEITEAYVSINECHNLLLKNKDDLNKTDLDKASGIIMSLLGTPFHPVANSLLQMKMNREKELAKIEANEEAQRTREFMSECLGWIHPGGL